MKNNRNNFAQIITKEEINKLSLCQFMGTVYIIDSLDGVSEALHLLEREPVLGFDTETRPSFKKGVKHRVALLQLASRHKAFLFRLNKTGLPEELAAMLSNEDIIKVGVAIDDDIKTLQKLRFFSSRGFVELQKYVKNFGIESNGLKKLAAIVLNCRISKSQRLSNWEASKLSDRQINYAATDAWICYEIYKTLSHTGIK